MPLFRKKKTAAKKNYEVIKETKPAGGGGGKESYGDEPPMCACDKKRCLNGRCGVCWLVIVGMSIALGIAAVCVFTGVLGFDFTTSGNETLYELICDDCTFEPTYSPTLDPTDGPTLSPTGTTDDPTTAPSKVPTVEPTPEPTSDPTVSPTDAPTDEPTGEPTPEPTEAPSEEPTAEPTVPTEEPTAAPTAEPTLEPTLAPTVPTNEPTDAPTGEPTVEPTADPTSERRRKYVPEATPNVLLIIADGTGFADAEVETPKVEEFLQEGYTFTNLHQSSRGSLMTGKSSSIEALQPCDEAHLETESATWAEKLRSKGYNNYFYGNWMLGADSWKSTPLGRGWDQFYGALNKPDGLERGDGGSWREVTGKCDSEPAKISNTKTHSQCLASCYEFQAAVFKNDQENSCKCHSDSSRCVTQSEDAMYMKSTQKETVIDWWRNDQPAHPNVGFTGDDLIIKEVKSHLQQLKKEKWSMIVSLTNPETFSGFAPHGTHTAINEACSKYFKEGGADFDYERGVSCQWSQEYDEKFGQVLETLKSRAMWEHTIVVLVSTEEKGSIFSVGGGALPAKFISRKNEDIHLMADVVPTILAVAGFSDSELESAKLDGLPVIDINEATAKTRKIGEATFKEVSFDEPAKADLKKCGSEISYTSAHGFRYNAPWVNRKFAKKK